MAGSNNEANRAQQPRAPRITMNIHGGLSTTVQDAVAQDDNVSVDDRGDDQPLRPISPSNVRGYASQDSALERHSSSRKRRDAVPMIAPIPTPLPRSTAIMHFPTALQEEATLAREQTSPSPPPVYQAEGPSDCPCARCLEAGDASVCRRGICRIFGDRELNISPLSQDTVSSERASPVSPLSTTPDTSHHASPPPYVTRTALTGEFFIQSADVLAPPLVPQVPPRPPPRAPRLPALDFGGELPNFEDLSLPVVEVERPVLLTATGRYDHVPLTYSE